MMAKNVQKLMKDIDLYQLNILANTKQNNSKNSHLVMSQWNCWKYINCLVHKEYTLKKEKSSSSENLMVEWPVWECSTYR